MATFVLTCLDRPGGLALRMATRPAHLDYLASQSAVIKLAGPMQDAAGDPCGSLLIIEVEDLAAAQAFAAADPYAQAGLFAATDIRPMRITVGPLA